MIFQIEKSFWESTKNVVTEFLSGLFYKESYVPWRNPYGVFGLLWGIPIPFFAFFLHLSLRGDSSSFSSFSRCFFEFPLLYTFLFLHPLLYCWLFGLMGTVRLRKDRQIEVLSQFMRDFLTEIQAVEQRETPQIKKRLEEMVQTNQKILKQNPSQKLSQLISQMGEVMTLKLSTMAYISNLMGQIQATMEKMGGASSQMQSESTSIEQGSRTLKEAIQHVSASSEEVAITSEKIFENAQAVEKSARETSEKSQVGQEEIQAFQGQMTEMQSRVRLVVERMKKLLGQVQKIGGIITLIEEISKQINLIAINALIESSVSGELGKRFSVVAQEVRRLAHITASSADQIKDLVGEIFLSSEQSLEASEAGLLAVEKGEVMSQNLTETFREIHGGSRLTTQNISQITTATKEQTQASKVLSSSLDEIQELAGKFHSSSEKFFLTLQELSESEENLYLLLDQNPQKKLGLDKT